jgi:hypothetical protein
VRRFNVAGAKIAREVVGNEAYVGGSIGPTGHVPGPDRAHELALARATFVEQAGALAEGGADLLVLETFRHLDELGVAIQAAREGAPKLAIAASVTFDSEGTVADGTGSRGGRSRCSASSGADLIGVNCGDGPQLSLVDGGAHARRRACRLCVQPNAGLPRNVDGRLLYMATPEYFDVFARRMLQAGAPHRWAAAAARRPSTSGGCRELRADARPRARGRRPSPTRPYEVEPARHPAHALEPVAARRAQQAFAEKVAEQGKFVVCVEVNPAPGLAPPTARSPRRRCWSTRASTS